RHVEGPQPPRARHMGGHRGELAQGHRSLWPGGALWGQGLVAEYPGCPRRVAGGVRTHERVGGFSGAAGSAAAMTRLGKFLRLFPADRRLLVTAALLQAAIRLGLAVLSYRKLRGLVDHLTLTSTQPAPPVSPERIAQAVTRASRAVPGATCLTQA